MTSVVHIGRRRLHGRVLLILQAAVAAGVPGAIRLLEGAVWELAASYDDAPRAELVTDPDELLEQPTEELLAVQTTSSTTLPSAPRPSISRSASAASSSA
jgi:hypothetical protein